jgi:hypothetical protein
MLFVLLAVLVMMLALLWPAFYNGEPFYFPDTTAYVRGADTAFHRITGTATPWSAVDDTTTDTTADASGDTPDADAAPTPARVDGGDPAKNKTVLAGRSVYYGALLYLGDRAGGFWLTTICQALCLIGTLALFFRAAGIALGTPFTITVIFLGLFTSIAFYSSFLMPDAFTGVAILACAALVGIDRQFERWQYVVWFVLLALALTFHTTHVLIAGMLLLVGLIRNLLRHRWSNWRGLAVILLCLVTASLADALFGLAVARMAGAKPMRPPFLMARLIDDGSGTRFLKETCPQSGFEVCRFVDRLPMQSDMFIWDTEHGVFSSAPPDVRRRIGAEQYRFVVAVVRRHPGDVIAEAFQNAFLQLIDIHYHEFDQSDPGSRQLESKLPAPYRAQFHASAAYQGRMPTDTYSVVTMIVDGLSTAAVLFMLLSPGSRRLLTGTQLTLTVLVLAAVVINAAICGTMSGPHGRYDTRVAWLVPFIAIAMGLALMRARRALVRSAGSAEPAV